MNGVILLNSARLVNGHYEIGPLLSSPAGQVIGVGVTNGPVAVEKIFQLIDQLPVTDRARSTKLRDATANGESQPAVPRTHWFRPRRAVVSMPSSWDRRW